MSLSDVLSSNAIRSVYQPIVRLDDAHVVAYEALARGPAGTSLERPDHLFAAARAAGRVPELDFACRAAAVRGARSADRLTLFINVEPDAVDVEPPQSLVRLLAAASGTIDVVFELTERALTRAPAELLRMVDAARARGWRIALDDVGAEAGSLALMPFLRPEVVKLDLRLVQQRPGIQVAEIVHAVNAHAERTGAVVLAEGIETERHLDVAKALGASLGQGWLFGRPAPRPDRDRPGPGHLALGTPQPPDTAYRSAYRQAAARLDPRRSTKPLLLAMSHHLEAQAATLGECAVVLGSFQERVNFTPKTSARYEELARRNGFVAALAHGLGAQPAAGVRGAELGEDDPLRQEWDVVVLGPHFAGAILALDLGDDGPDHERRFDFVVTYDRELVTAVATTLMGRVTKRVAQDPAPGRTTSQPSRSHEHVRVAPER